MKESPPTLMFEGVIYKQELVWFNICTQGGQLCLHCMTMKEASFDLLVLLVLVCMTLRIEVVL